MSTNEPTIEGRVSATNSKDHCSKPTRMGSLASWPPVSSMKSTILAYAYSMALRRVAICRSSSDFLAIEVRKIKFTNLCLYNNTKPNIYPNANAVTAPIIAIRYWLTVALSGRFRAYSANAKHASIIAGIAREYSFCELLDGLCLTMFFWFLISSMINNIINIGVNSEAILKPIINNVLTLASFANRHTSNATDQITAVANKSLLVLAGLVDLLVINISFRIVP